ncbi:MAG: HlyD family secretion protein [Geminicoccaceae bacterium]
MRPLAATLLLGLLLAGCDSPDDGWLQGYAEGEYVRLGAPAAGWLESVPIQRGDRVEPGTLLFRLESVRQVAAVRQAEAQLTQARATLADLQRGKRPEEIAMIEAKLAEARATLTYAQRDFDRQTKLERRDFAAEARLDQARSNAAEAAARVAAIEAELATAELPAREDQITAAAAEVGMREAALAQARWELAQRMVNAPMAATVEDRVRDQGEWVDAGGIVVSLLPPEKVKVRFFLPEPELGRIALGQQVDLRCDGCADGLTGTVRFIAKEAEYTPPVIYSVGSREKLVYLVEAWPDGGAGLNPGQPVDVRPR